MPLGEAVEELREDVRYFLRAFLRPVLREETAQGKPALVADEARAEINDGHYFELMDRVWVALSHAYEFVGSHPLTRKDDGLRALYEKAEAALHDLYQEAGRLYVEIADG